MRPGGAAQPCVDVVVTLLVAGARRVRRAGVGRQAVPHAVAVDGADAASVGDRIVAARFCTASPIPQRGDIIVFHPNGGRRRGGRSADHGGHRDVRQAADRDARGVDPGARRPRPGVHRRRRRSGCRDAAASPTCRRRRRTSGRSKIPRGPLLHDGRQPRRTHDSRDWGPIGASQMIGRVFMIYWPLTRIASSSGAAGIRARLNERAGPYPGRIAWPSPSAAAAGTNARPGRRLLRFDRALGSRWVAGADEAGRGCLAGPLVTAGVLLDHDQLRGRACAPLGLLDDSKRRTPEMRERLFDAVLGCAERVAVIVIPRRRSTSAGCTARTWPAWRRRSTGSTPRPDAVLLTDGFRVPLARQHRAVVDGDAKSAAIAAASIVAKVTRDRLMHREHERYPLYGFDEHVGYIHAAAQGRGAPHGPCPLHRRSFVSLAYTSSRWCPTRAGRRRWSGESGAARRAGGAARRSPPGSCGCGGVRVLARNVRVRGGWRGRRAGPRGRTLVLVEVKSRRAGGGEEAVGWRGSARCARCAEACWPIRPRLGATRSRFDVVAVDAWRARLPARRVLASAWSRRLDRVGSGAYARRADPKGTWWPSIPSSQRRLIRASSSSRRTSPRRSSSRPPRARSWPSSGAPRPSSGRSSRRSSRTRCGCAARTRARSSSSTTASTGWPTRPAGRRPTGTCSTATRSRRARGRWSGGWRSSASTVQLTDARDDPLYAWHAARELGGFRTILGVPMLADRGVVGVISVWRTRGRPVLGAGDRGLSRRSPRRRPSPSRTSACSARRSCTAPSSPARSRSSTCSARSARP